MLEGRTPEKLVVTNAICLEVYYINRISELIDGITLFKHDYGQYFEHKPLELAYLIRPTQKELFSFYALLDKILSENINKDFFKKSLVMYTERIDGEHTVKQYKGTITLLNEWVVNRYPSIEQNVEWQSAIGNFRDVRKQRQKPAHSIISDKFDQSIFEQQREIFTNTYDSLRFIRMTLQQDSNIQANNINVSKALDRKNIWFF